MERKFTRNEKVDLLLIYGECRKNATAACILYSERFPLRQRQPSRNYFARLERQFRIEPDDNVHDQDSFIIDAETETNVLAVVYVDPTISLRQIEHELPVGRESARKILKKHGFKPYKYQIHQRLYENDNQRRVQYCNWLLENHVRNPNMTRNILFSDESRFTNLGMFNRNNTRYWATENPRLIRQGNFQERFGFNVWMGLIGSRIIGPIIFDGMLNGQRYLGFLRNEIEGFMENLPLDVYQNMYFQQDGAPPHNSRIVTSYLDENFPNRWIGTNGPTRWPPRSPDLTPLDFFIWGYLKNKVYSSSPTSREDLEHRLREAIASITQAQLNRVMEAIVRRAILCREHNGEQFEQYL